MYYGHRTPWLFAAALFVGVFLVAVFFRVTDWLGAAGLPRSVAVLVVFGAGVLSLLVGALAAARWLS